MDFEYDVVIVGGGAAGLSAALILARARRAVLVCDEGNTRNRFSKAMHGFITRDGISPTDWIAHARQDLSRYPSIHLRHCRVDDAVAIEGGFEVRFEVDCQPVRCKKLLLATGVIDALPAVPGIDQFYGTSIFHCPYCDGFEVAGLKLAAYGKGDAGRQIALELLGWSDRVMLFTDGPSELDGRQREQLQKCNVQLVETKIAALRGNDGHLEAIEFIDGTRTFCDAMFFKTAFFEKSKLAEGLGCDIDSKGLYQTQKFESTNIPGLFVAGDASKHLHLVIEACASGAEAAFAINTQLLHEDISRRSKGRQDLPRSA